MLIFSSKVPAVLTHKTCSLDFLTYFIYSGLFTFQIERTSGFISYGSFAEINSLFLFFFLLETGSHYDVALAVRKFLM